MRWREGGVHDANRERKLKVKCHAHEDASLDYCDVHQEFMMKRRIDEREKWRSWATCNIPGWYVGEATVETRAVGDCTQHVRVCSGEGEGNGEISLLL